MFAVFAGIHVIFINNNNNSQKERSTNENLAINKSLMASWFLSELIWVDNELSKFNSFKAGHQIITDIIVVYSSYFGTLYTIRKLDSLHSLTFTSPISSGRWIVRLLFIFTETISQPIEPYIVSLELKINLLNAKQDLDQEA